MPGRRRAPPSASSSSEFEPLCTIDTRRVCFSLLPVELYDLRCHRGRTQIAAGSRTVLGIIGKYTPLLVDGNQQRHSGPSRLVNQVTSALRLL